MAAIQTEDNSRQRQADHLTLLFNILNGAGWLLLLVAVGLIAKAKPEMTGKVFGFQVYGAARTFWKMSTAEYALYCMIAALIFGLTGLLLNSLRLKRKGDFVRISLILQSTAAGLGIGIYWKFLGF